MTPQQVHMGPPPIPGGIAAVFRFFFNVPQWIQIGGLIVGVLVAAAVVWWLWRHRVAVLARLRAMPKKTKIAFASGVAVILLVALGTGAASWNYMQNNNDFCTGCHLMNQPFQRFGTSEHASLRCHDCHTQSLWADAMELYGWVAERPEVIPPHEKLDNAVCAKCHVRGDAKATWQAIAATSGHRAHLESPALPDLQCVTCHGHEIHRFATTNQTCEQCHTNVKITLAKMQGQTDLHCAACHQFNVEIPALATRDSAAAALTPSMKQCFSCHAMQNVLANFDPARDPHRGTCGYCHNPHTQVEAHDAALTCASAQCHVGWRSNAFHTGGNHKAVVSVTTCTLCHVPHRAKVDPSDCAGCHSAVKGRRDGQGQHLDPPLPFDTTKALQQSSRPARGLHFQSRGNGPFFFFDQPRAVAADSFRHERHKKLACLTCHPTKGESRLTFQPPRGCQICHHQAPQKSDCTRCHGPDERGGIEQVTVRVKVGEKLRREHPGQFDHAKHANVKCAACHTTPATLDPSPAAAGCADCHDAHHAEGRPCASCHPATGTEFQAAHAPPAQAHAACDACHEPSIVARLVPDRGLCVTCHPAQREHNAGVECTTCHFFSTPTEYRARLSGAAQ